MTGLRSEGIDAGCSIEVAGRTIAHARVFSGAAPGALLWYANSIGLVEIAANQASAADLLGLTIGQRVVTDR
jgi:S-adenosyl-L-methionine hydrolase (adenosine-forming)